MPAYADGPGVQAPSPESLVDVFQQRYGIAGVPVKPVAPITVQILPSKVGAIISTPIGVPDANGAVPVEVVGRDLRRRRLVLISDVDWAVCRASSDKHGAPWPKGVPLVLEHGDQVYAISQGTAGTVSGVSESWAD